MRGDDVLCWERLPTVQVHAGEACSGAESGGRRIDPQSGRQIQYVVLEGEAGHQGWIIRTENAVDTLKRKGIEVEKLSYGSRTGTGAGAEPDAADDQPHQTDRLVLAEQ